MAFLDELIRQQQVALSQPVGANLGVPRGGAYASYYNPIDVTAPSYITPNAYTLSQVGYRTNEFAYSIMGIRASAKSEAIVRVKKRMGTQSRDDDVVVENHPLTELLANSNPAPYMTQPMFYAVKQIIQDISGFAAFEVEYKNNGDIKNLWLMTPYFCSFLRGQGQPLRAIRYQPFGLPPQDIPFIDDYGRTKILFFSDSENFDPLQDRVRFRSPLMAALNQIEVDNAMTFFLRDFVQHGAKFSGLLSVSQTIDDTIANDYKRRFRDTHGGTQNWSDPLVLGLGTTYQSMQMNFRDMAFPELDARTETRICNAFKISPIVAEARAGLDVSSYNNKEQAEKNWYYKWVIPSWKNDADALGKQLLPMYHDDPENYYVEMDMSDVYALKEDRTSQVERAVKLWDSQLAKRNEARAELGLPPDEEGGDEYKTVSSPFSASPFEAKDNPKDEPTDQNPKDKTEEDTKAEEEEIKSFRAFARRRIKEGKAGDIPLFEWKYVELSRASELVQAAMAEAVTNKLDAVLEKG